MDSVLNKFKNEVDIAVVGGSNLFKQKEKLGDSLYHFKYIFSENGLMSYKVLPEKTLENFHSTSIVEFLGETNFQRLINECLKVMSEITIPKKRGTFIEHRNGMINICPVGRSCTQEERDEFFEYDNEHKVREGIVEKLQESCADLNLSFSIGGQISIDIFPKGWDKTYALQFVKNDYDRILFFGDKTEPGGNDYEIFSHDLTESYHVDNPEMTIGYLNSKFFDDV
jgi:phosphomannomutase